MKTVFILYVTKGTYVGSEMVVESVADSEATGLAFANLRAVSYKYGKPEKSKDDTGFVRYEWRSKQGYQNQVLVEKKLLEMADFI